MDPIPLMALAEIRIRLGGISSQRVDFLTRRSDFPRPVAMLKVGRIWHRTDIESWIQTRRPNDVIDDQQS
jgi:prophage regulatory protein